MDIFAKRLKNLRIDNGLTQQELADAIGTTRSAVAQWESGNNRPISKTIEKIAEVLNTDVNYLLGTETIQQSELERKLIQAGLKDKINNLSDKQYDALITLIDNLIADKDKKN
ncbi:MAG TPA: helix-turn-helix transcriptional regulator [Clostridiales bacterium]|nr:helix-turn-helix transcriptional regulator [Clostridiales bacterium]